MNFDVVLTFLGIAHGDAIKNNLFGAFVSFPYCSVFIVSINLSI